MNNSAATRAITKIALEYNGNDKGYAECTADNNLLSSDPEEQYWEMKTVADRNPRVKKWALTGYISPPKEIGDKLTDKELTEIALEALKKVGVSNNQYRLDVHYSSKQRHIHFIVNRISTDSTCTVKARNIGKRFGEAVREVCRERNLPTDIEIGIQKRQEMLNQLTQSLRSAHHFDDLILLMAKEGYEVKLSSNVKVGISGMRIVMEKDKNFETQRQYKGGYKLSEITNKLKVEEIKEIFRIKILFREHLKTSRNVEELKQKLYQAGYYLNLKYDNNFKDLSSLRNKNKVLLKNVFIKPIPKGNAYDSNSSYTNSSNNNKLTKNGMFYNKYSGFNYDEIDADFSIQSLQDLDSISKLNKTSITRNPTNALEITGEIIDDLFKPTYTKSTYIPSNDDDELLRRRKKKR
ncbi:hypothetical protein CMV00_11840 [Elizabethkingia anophelis]|nr:hypothetical protein [Elizabethkingia anophelis]